jgi:CRP-like cAMP-binding protein
MAQHANALIRKLEKLQPLSGPEKAFLESFCSAVVTVEAGADIVRERDRPTDSNVLLQGMSCRYKILADGRRQIFSFHLPGDVFDAHSFLLNIMDHSVAALTPCTLGIIPHTTMMRITEDYPRIARAIWKDTLVDAAVFREWMASIGRRSAYQRIAHLMCELYLRYDAVGLTTDHQIDWPITQAEVGDALGLSVVHVNRTLQELRRSGLVTLQGNRLTIHDWEGLNDAGDFDPSYLHLSDVQILQRAAV